MQCAVDKFSHGHRQAGIAMRGMFEERYRGYRIIVSDLGRGWQARIEGIAALSDCRPTPLDAITETKRYLDDQAAESEQLNQQRRRWSLLRATRGLSSERPIQCTPRRARKTRGNSQIVNS